MKASITWWDLSESTQTIESLRDYLRDGAVEPWERVEGLRLKLWIADPVGNRWGAVMIWESDDFGAGQELPPHRAMELIGHPPTERVRFDVEATVEGRFTDPRLSGLGVGSAGGAA
ncbi:hypothetical protein [Actinophytocola gossypii]|uniref:Uncharacterized protein n=1 Tax=Actinophytocola gossypii TaxID=2812003 RepID=A0ABT2J374_9PSEU|nr:hypothetical protein [Actinophytocola gossypii]MCT2581950.1 hypothetical protein [Actinophytocola gossypii]